MQGKTVGLKLKTVTFELKTKVQTLLNYTQDAEQIYNTAKEILRAEITACSPQPLKLRLLGE